MGPGTGMVAVTPFMQWQIAPEQLGDIIREATDCLVAKSEQVAPHAFLYAEKTGGFQCRSCCWAIATNSTHGKCKIMQGTIDLDCGCCIAWKADLSQLQLHKEF